MVKVLVVEDEASIREMIALNLRLAELVGLPFSIENVLMNLFLFIPQLIWGRRYIGLGTIINSFCIGFIVTFTGDAMTAVFGSADTLPVQLLWVAVAVLVIALGCSLYQTADLGVAPYDALSLMMADRLPVPYFGCRVFTDALCAVITFVSGGLIGLGTLICAFGLGPFVQFFSKNFNFFLLFSECFQFPCSQFPVGCGDFLFFPAVFSLFSSFPSYTHYNKEDFHYEHHYRHRPRLLRSLIQQMVRARR